eukprot:6201539-Pleurochrysis_carterae.AAC.1
MSRAWPSSPRALLKQRTTPSCLSRVGSGCGSRCAQTREMRPISPLFSSSASASAQSFSLHSTQSTSSSPKRRRKS